jgi:hypothetical protein
MTNDPDAPVLIMPHRGKLWLLALGAAAFVAGSVWMAVAMPYGGLLSLPRWSSLAIAIVCVIFFGFCWVYALLRLVRRSPVLVIDADGIDECGSALGVGRLHWSEVAGVGVETFMGQSFLTIQVHDPAAIIARRPRILRPLFRFNHRVTGSPINVPASILPAPPEVIRGRIEAFRLRAPAH